MSATVTVNGAELLKGSVVDAFIKYKQPTLSLVTDWTMAGTIVSNELTKSGKGPVTEKWSDSKAYDPSNWTNSLEFTSDKGSKLYTGSTVSFANNNSYATTNGFFNLSSDPANKNPSISSPLYGLFDNFSTINRVDTDSNGHITQRQFSSTNEFNFNEIKTAFGEQSPLNISVNLSRKDNASATSYNGVNSYTSQSSLQEGFQKDGYILNASVFKWDTGSFDGSLDADPSTLVFKHKVSWSQIQQYVFSDDNNGFSVSFTGAGSSNQDANTTTTNLRQVIWKDTKAGYQISKLDGSVTINSAYSDQMPSIGLSGSDDLTKVKSVFSDAFYKAIIDSGVVITATNASGSSLVGGKGNDTFYGGAGLDTVVFTGKKADYTLSSGNGSTSVTDKLGRDGVDTLMSIEKLKFSDSVLDFSTNDTSAQVYRVYKAVLGRPADEGGLGYWTYLIDHGLKLKDLVNSFFGSQEFRTNFNASDNKAFVDLVYKNVLGRAPEQSGSDYWVGELNKGFDRADLLTGFSESNEFKIKIVGELQNGMSYTEYHPV